MINHYDVIVLGGGIAGVSAALSAARENKKVALIEKNIYLGGLATHGLVTIFLPLCDGQGHQMTYGIAEELFHLSIKMGWQRKYPKPWIEGGTKEEKIKKRYEVQFNPIYFSLLMEELLIQNYVDIYYDSMVIDTGCKENKIEYIIADTNEEKHKLFATSFIDASGSAKLFSLSNIQLRTYDKKNILAGWYYYKLKENITLNMLGSVEKSDYLDDERHVDEPLSVKRYDGTIFEDKNQFILDSHKNMLLDMKKKQIQDSSFEAVCIPTQPQIRVIQTLYGECTLTDQPNVKIEDSIGVVGDWRRRGYRYEIPFSCMYSKKLENVFVAGRCVSCDDNMSEITRVIPSCALTGEAAGIAASLYCEKNHIDIKEVQMNLKRRNIKIHIDEILSN